MTIIALSNDLSTWSTTFSNGEPLYKYVENSKISQRQAIKLGSLQSNNIRLTVSATPAHVAEFIGYKYIKVTVDSSVVFVGVFNTSNKRAIDTDFQECEIQYNDLSANWKDALFCENPRTLWLNHDSRAYDMGEMVAEQKTIEVQQNTVNVLYNLWKDPAYANWAEFYQKAYLEARAKLEDMQSGRGSGSYGWTWAIDSTANIKVCDPLHPSASMVHLICAYLPNYSLLTINALCTKPDIVTAFKVESVTKDADLDVPADIKQYATGDKVLETLLAFCAQNCINVTLDGFTLTFTEAYTPSTTATTVQVEAEATKMEKPYKTYSYDDVKFPSEVLHLVFDKNAPSYARDSMFYIKLAGETRSIVPPANEPMMQLPYTFDIPQNMELLHTEITGSETERSAVKTKLFSSGYIGNTKATIINYYYHLDKCYARVSCNYDSSVKNADFKIRFFGNATLVGYTTTLKSSGNRSGKVTKFPYIYSEDSARKYDALRQWFDLADANYWTFTTEQDLAVGSTVALSGVDNNALIVTSKTKRWDNGIYYIYTASKAVDSVAVSVDTAFTPVDVNLPANDHSIFVQCTRQNIACTNGGAPKDTTPPRILIDTDGTEPSLKVNNTEVTLTREQVTTPADDGDVITEANRWYYDVTLPSTMSTPISFVASVGAVTRNGSIGIIFDGEKGETGETGETGEDGTDGAYTEYQFAKNTSQTTAPTTGWQNSPIGVSDGEYLWMRQRRVTF